mmetsp:Transcript_50432/g.128435  ORF Transcript_50432/g.128435 Transcript_50432/m.128435 type:complete len:265 (+) Transcript_50432:1254-2048(+)
MSLPLHWCLMTMFPSLSGFVVQSTTNFGVNSPEIVVTFESPPFPLKSWTCQSPPRRPSLPDVSKRSNPSSSASLMDHDRRTQVSSSTPTTFSQQISSHLSFIQAHFVSSSSHLPWSEIFGQSSVKGVTPTLIVGPSKLSTSSFSKSFEIVSNCFLRSGGLPLSGIWATIRTTTTLGICSSSSSSSSPFSSSSPSSFPSSSFSSFPSASGCSSSTVASLSLSTRTLSTLTLTVLLPKISFILPCKSFLKSSRLNCFLSKGSTSSS